VEEPTPTRSYEEKKAAVIAFLDELLEERARATDEGPPDSKPRR